MAEFTSARLAELRAVAEAATPGPWRHWNPSTGPSHVTIGGMVAFESLQSATPFADDEVIPHWADAYHIATFDPPTVLALIAALEAKTAEAQRLRAMGQGLIKQRDEARVEVERLARIDAIATAAGKVTPCSCSAQRARADRAEAALERIKAPRFTNHLYFTIVSNPLLNSEAGELLYDSIIALITQALEAGADDA